MKILLVEDSRTVAAVMAARLTAFGYDVSLAENGQVAVERFAELAPDLVLMDIEMPVMNGFEATNRIRALEATQQWAWTPILFLTASDTAENLVTAIDAGGDDFLAKTLPEGVLHAKMKAMSRIATLRRRFAEANRKLADQASRDGLTGLFNRRYMDLRCDELWGEVTRQGEPFGLLMIDVDNFKKYNDHYGHQQGDDCLRAIAQALDSVVGEAVAGAMPTADTSGIFAARYGGEEFAVILPCVSSTVCESVAGQVLAAVRAHEMPHQENAAWGIVTVSIGGAHKDKADGRIVDIFRAADERLYRAKEAGRNCVELGADTCTQTTKNVAEMCVTSGG